MSSGMMQEPCGSIQLLAMTRTMTAMVTITIILGDNGDNDVAHANDDDD